MSKAIKTITPLESMLCCFDVKVKSAISGQIPEHRQDVFTTKVKDIVIDTCCAHDTRVWETGINRGKWIIVEQYQTRELAEIGHQKWVKKIQKNSERELSDINLFNL